MPGTMTLRLTVCEMLLNLAMAAEEEHLKKVTAEVLVQTLLEVEVAVVHKTLEAEEVKVPAM